MGLKESVNEFMTDFKEMFKKRDISKVNEKYLQPTWESTKVVALKTWDVLLENTPKVVAASKEAVHKVQDRVSEYSKKIPKEPESKQGSQPSSEESKSNNPKSKP